MSAIPWWAFTLVAVAAVTVTEYMNRMAPGSFWKILPYTLPLILTAQWGLFYSWNKAPTLLLASATFSMTTAIFRLLNAHFFVGESLSVQAVLGVGLIIAGTYVVKTS